MHCISWSTSNFCPHSQLGPIDNGGQWRRRIHAWGATRSTMPRPLSSERARHWGGAQGAPPPWEAKKLDNSFKFVQILTKFLSSPPPPLSLWAEFPATSLHLSFFVCPDHLILFLTFTINQDFDNNPAQDREQPFGPTISVSQASNPLPKSACATCFILSGSALGLINDRRGSMPTAYAGIAVGSPCVVPSADFKFHATRNEQPRGSALAISDVCGHGWAEILFVVACQGGAG